MNIHDAIPYVGHYCDDAQSCDPFEIDSLTVLVGWQCGFEPMFVATRSYLGVRIDDGEAAELATDLLVELEWFTDNENPSEPDYILRA